MLAPSVFAMYNTNLPLHIARMYWDLPRSYGTEKNCDSNIADVDYVAMRMLCGSYLNTFYSVPFGSYCVLRRDPNESEAENADPFS